MFLAKLISLLYVPKYLDPFYLRVLNLNKATGLPIFQDTFFRFLWSNDFSIWLNLFNIMVWFDFLKSP